VSSAACKASTCDVMRDARIHHDATHEVRGAGHREISCASCVFTDKGALKGQKARQVLRAGQDIARECWPICIDELSHSTHHGMGKRMFNGLVPC